MLRTTRKPLILFTPKRYLRGKEAYSPVEDFTRGHFREVLDDPVVEDREAVRRVVLATGKIALDAMGTRGSDRTPRRCCGPRRAAVPVAG